MILRRLNDTRTDCDKYPFSCHKAHIYNKNEMMADGFKKLLQSGNTLRAGGEQIYGAFQQQFHFGDGYFSSFSIRRFDSLHVLVLVLSY